MMETHNAHVQPKWKATTTDGFILSHGPERKKVEQDAEHHARQLDETIHLKRRYPDSNDYDIVRDVEPSILIQQRQSSRSAKP